MLQYVTHTLASECHLELHLELEEEVKAKRMGMEEIRMEEDEIGVMKEIGIGSEMEMDMDMVACIGVKAIDEHYKNKAYTTIPWLDFVRGTPDSRWNLL